MSGWQRLSVVLVVLASLVYAYGQSARMPTQRDISNFHERNMNDIKDCQQRYIVGVDLRTSSYPICNEGMATSAEFLMEKAQERYDQRIQNLTQEQMIFIGKSIGIWLASLAAAFVVFAALSWVVRGFRKPTNPSKT